MMNGPIKATYLAFFGLVSATAVSIPAFADPITAVSVSNVQVNWAQGEGTNTNVEGIYYAGPISYTVNFGTGNLQLITWCDDLNNIVYIGSSEQYYATDAHDANGYLSPLSISIDHEIAGLAFEGTILAQSNSLNPATGAAYQMAIWELQYAGLQDTSPSLQTSVNSLLAQATTDYLQMRHDGYTYSQLEAPGCDQQPGSITYTNTCQVQGQIYIHKAVPEPGSLALIGSGLFGMSLWRRRKARKTA